MYTKTIPSGVIGQVLARGVSYLSLAKATLNSPVFSMSADDSSSSSFPLFQANKLKYLDMSACTLSTADLEDLTSTCHTLEKLSLEKIVNVSLKVCRNVANQNADTLEILNLCDCSQLSSDGIQSILEKCQSLTEINLAFTNITK